MFSAAFTGAIFIYKTLLQIKTSINRSKLRNGGLILLVVCRGKPVNKLFKVAVLT